MGVKHTVLPDGQRPTVAFTVLAQLCGPKANETEKGSTLFTKNGEGRKLDFDLIDLIDYPLDLKRALSMMNSVLTLWIT